MSSEPGNFIQYDNGGNATSSFVFYNKRFHAVYMISCSLEYDYKFFPGPMDSKYFLSIRSQLVRFMVHS